MDSKVPNLTPISEISLQDELYIVQKNDLTDSPSGSSRFGTVQQFADFIATIVKSAVENNYLTINEMLQDQASQLEGNFQFVEDASTDPTVTSGSAYYVKLDATTGALSDYNKLTTQEAEDIIASGPAFNHLTVKQIETTQIVETDPFVTVSFMYDAVTGKIQSAIFNPVFTKYLTRYMDLLPDTTLTLQFWNTSQNLGLAATITNFEYTEYTGTTLFLKADLVNTINQSDVKVGDVLVTDISVGGVKGQDVIEVDRYENIPLKKGVYSIYIYNEGGSAVFPSEYSLELPTNVFRYSDNTTILSPNFMQYSDDQTIVKREFRINDSGYVLTDTFYDINGVEIGTVLPQETTPTLNVSYSFYSSVKYVSDLYDNSYIRLNKPFGAESLNPIFGNINIKLNELNYENGLLSFDFDFPEYIKIEEASLIYGNFSTQNFKIGLIESDTENKLGILDYSGILENDVTKNEVVLNVVYTETISTLASKRIKPFNNSNTLVNVVNLEQEVPHSNAMTLTFEEFYGVFNGIVYNASSPNIEDLFNVNIFETERQSVNADIYFSAGSGMGFLKTFDLEDSYGIVPLGSNDLIRQDVTDSIDKFPPNYIAVTSRSETDNDGTDTLGTSYGFGVEFNEPTLSADLTGQGLTDWGGSNEHQQSPATAIVAAKLKYIKDQTGATWDIVREAARRSASNYGNYNIYRGFGVIDTAIAIAQVPNVQKERSLVLAEYWKHATPFNQNLLFEDKTDFTAVVKNDLKNLDLIRLKPKPQPTTPTEGLIYFDDTSKKLRCYDGITWNDLF